MAAAKRIVVGLDGSANARGAMAWAVAHARATDATVEALYVWQVPALAYSAPGYIPPEAGFLDDYARRMLDEAIGGIPAAGAVGARVEVVEGSPPAELAAESEHADVEAVVVGAQGHGAVSRLLLGSVSHALTHRCHKPLVIVPQGWVGGDGRVVVGVDGSEGSLRALRWAVAQAQKRGWKVDAVTVVGGHPGDAAAASAANRLEEILDAAGLGASIGERTVLHGDAARALTGHAGGAELLVVGRRGLGPAREMVLGSVSHACAHHSPVPVAVIPAKS